MYVLAIIPGPTEPTSMAVYLEPILADFVNFGPSSENGLTVKDAGGQTLKHKIFLGGIFAGMFGECNWSDCVALCGILKLILLS